MKSRVKIDSALVSFVIILSGFLYRFPTLYRVGQFGDNVLDILGFIVILKGVFIRMAGRGHKKVNSEQGQGLVTSGLYAYMRNPMYLGSFLIGAGFVLLVWPWWSLPVFAFLFYIRFKVQIEKEEKHLIKTFGQEYEEYCSRVPRLFPDIKSVLEMNVKKAFKWDELWNTKEKGMLFGLPILAVFLEMFQEKIVFDSVNIKGIIVLFLFSSCLFALISWYRYRIS